MMKHNLLATIVSRNEYHYFNRMQWNLDLIYFSVFMKLKL